MAAVVLANGAPLGNLKDRLKGRRILIRCWCAITVSALR